MSIRSRLEALEKDVLKRAAQNQGRHIPYLEALGMLSGGAYQSRWIREQYGIHDPISEAEDEFWAKHDKWDEEDCYKLICKKLLEDPDPKWREGLVQD